MSNVQIIRGNFHIDDPDWPKYAIRKIITSDTFSRSGYLPGSMSDTALGGLPMKWEGRGDGWSVLNGVARPSQKNWADEARLVGLPADVGVYFTLASEDNATGSLMINLRSSSDNNRRIRIEILHNGSIRLGEYVDGSQTNFTDYVSRVAAVGDTVAVEASGNTVTVAVNESEIIRHGMSTTQAGDVWLGAYPLSDRRVDDLIIYEV